MSLNELPERYEQIAALSDKVNLFWTLAPSSSPDGGDDREIRFAVAYLLPRRSLLREHEEVTVVSRDRNCCANTKKWQYCRTERTKL